MKRIWPQASGGRRRVLLALLAAVCLGGVGAAIAVVAAGGSSKATPSPPPTRDATSVRREHTSSRPARHHISAAALARRYQRQRQRAAARSQRRRANLRSSASMPPATRGAGALGGRPVQSNRTSCGQVVHIGDSTSEGLDSPSYLPDRHDRIGAQYARVGAIWQPEIEGATSVVETLPGKTNAYDVARRLVGTGYRGCWVIALGTNDAADVAVGSSVGLPTRIARMMSVIGHQPVLWVNAKTLVGSGSYAESNMEGWNRALLAACPRYPNMRVFDWAAVAKDGWFIPDGIHYSSAGYAARARLIADALARAFPASGPSPGCVVR